MQRSILFIIIFLFPLFILAQEKAVLDKAHAAISFEDFVAEIEAVSDIYFYYKQDWTDSVVFKNTAKNASVYEVLDQQAQDLGLSYYVRGNRLFVLPVNMLTTKLPDYHTQPTIAGVNGSGQRKDTLDDQYMRTREFLAAQSLIIGSKRDHIAGRTCRIRGTIFNQLDNEALIGATVYVNELELGLISDKNGRFEMRLPPGQYSVDVNHMSMKEMHYKLEVFSDGNFPIGLMEELHEIEEVTISDTRFDNVKSMQMGQDRISIKTIKEIPIVMGERDIIKIAQMLPGVQNVGEGSAGINVRGGTPDQNMFYINRVPVYNTSHLFGFFTAFNPDVINDFTLYKNNIPAKYGGRIASVFDISTRKGHKDKYYAQGGISPVTGHFSVEGPIVKDKVSFVAGLRSTYSDWLLRQIDDYEINNSSASFYDGTLEFNAEINEKNEIGLFLYHSSDTFSLAGLNEYDYANSGASLIWNHSFNKLRSANFSYALSDYNFSSIDKTNISEAYQQDFRISHHELRADFLMLDFSAHRIEYGASSVLYKLDRGTIAPFGEESTRAPIEKGLETGLENSVYLSDEYKLSNRMTLLGGLRFSMYSFLGPQTVFEYAENNARESGNIINTLDFDKGEMVRSYYGIEPRLAMNFLLSESSSVKASYNRIKQYLFMLSNTIAISPNDQWKLTDYHIEPPIADQISVGYYKDIKDQGINLSLELYNKWVHHVVDYKNGADFISDVPVEQQVMQGDQNVAGVEFLLKRNKGKLSGWLSYTYSRSNITMDSPYPGESVNRGNPYPSNYDRPHSVNLASNYRHSKRVSVSANVVYYTGRPITLPVGVYHSGGQKIFLYSDRNQYRVPDYFRVDLSINLEGNLNFKKLGHSYWMLNVYNLTGRKNAYSVFYTVERGDIGGYLLSVFPRPIFTVSWQFKLGNYTNE